MSTSEDGPEAGSRRGTVHVPIMVREVLEALRVENGGDFLDVTLGGGGHTAAILGASPNARVFATDRDPAAVSRARSNFSAHSERFQVSQARFSDVGAVIGDREFDGVLADLGVSTDQLKGGRGFSFTDSESLDMRMGDDGPTAAELVNSMSERELFIMLKEGGVGNEAKPVARAICSARPFASAAELSAAVNRAAAYAAKKRETNPSTVVFQAIRMAVNGERDEIGALLDAAPSWLKPGGRLVVITFHSLEDRLVAHRMREWEQGDTSPAWWPGRSGGEGCGRVVDRKGSKPGEAEIAANPSSRSARLRVFEFDSSARERLAMEAPKKNSRK